MRPREQDPWLIERAFDRIAGLLERLGWQVRVSAPPVQDAPVDQLHGRSRFTSTGMDPIGLATQGRLGLVFSRGQLRIRYVPTLLGFLGASALAGYAVGWVIRDVVEYGINTREAAIWFYTPPRYVLQYAIGALFAYPVLRWRFVRMCRKALRLSAAGWKRYASVTHMWKRASVSVFVCFWPFVETTNWWMRRLSAALHDMILHGASPADPGALVWLTLQMLLLGIGVFCVDWDLLLFHGPGRLDELSRRLLPPPSPLT